MKMIRSSLFIAVSVVTMTELLHWLKNLVAQRVAQRAVENQAANEPANQPANESTKTTDRYGQFASHSYVLKHRYLSPETIVELLRHYPMSLSCGSAHTAIAVSDQTPGYETRDRPYRVIASQWSHDTDNLLDEFPSPDQMARYMELVSYAEIARGLSPLFEHAHMFERAIAGVRWSRVIDRLLADGLVTVRTTDDGQRILTAINGVSIREQPVDALLSDGAHETALLSLLVRGTISDSLPSDFSTHVHEASTNVVVNTVNTVNDVDVNNGNDTAYDVVAIADDDDNF